MYLIVFHYRNKGMYRLPYKKGFKTLFWLKRTERSEIQPELFWSSHSSSHQHPATGKGCREERGGGNRETDTPLCTQQYELNLHGAGGLLISGGAAAVMTRVVRYCPNF